MDAPLVFDLNTAPLELFWTIPGVSLAEARALDQARRQRRGFRDLDELGKLPGARARTAQALRATRAARQAAPTER